VKMGNYEIEFLEQIIALWEACMACDNDIDEDSGKLLSEFLVNEIDWTIPLL